MGFCFSKSNTPVFVLQNDPKVGNVEEDYLRQNSEEIHVDVRTHLFQNTEKIKFEKTENGIRNNAETHTDSYSDNALHSVTYVKETDGLEMTDVE
ncbi:uncharacterized protein C2orf15 homolog [Mauremys reevesii]|uniref:uncharacterized protein C2orf15 homolog n=1 Tax=Mauremys reevesii TaxID=260615 RepID=UPI00193F4F4A|nr:uncharacterized protein C2orf15 homolog [Mauremys reevesii]XP_039375730.1 uncharacterized protein C2orf15 homolog [Mauremys reevesii]XP_039375731.1 uncharacterized protein C2orf15 homolog [Mauremys reevesii]